MSDFFEQNAQEALRCLKALCAIPAPSHHEEQRAEWCAQRLKAYGAQRVSIDEAGSVVCADWARDAGNVLVMAHLDTVFDENTDLTLRAEGSVWHCPGIGDDTVNAVAVLMLTKYLLETHAQPRRGVILALNTGEEGLGNLKGCRQLMRDWAGRVDEVVSFDLYRDEVYTDCIGSRRYRISASCEGGHSFHDFGKPNAIAVLSGILTELYAYVPAPGTDTTYNVGTIQGGSSVNVIARDAQCLWEFRSRDGGALAAADVHLQEVLERHRTEGVTLRCEVVGERPCRGDVDESAVQALAKDCQAAILEETGVHAKLAVASTDCNVPLSLGIPAVCWWLVRGGGAHTLGEWIDADTVIPGCRAALNLLNRRAGLQ